MNGGKHIDNKDLSRYFMNEMSGDEESMVQEHIGECTWCRKKIQDMRKLKIEFDKIDTLHGNRHLFIRVINSTWTRVAATLLVIAAVGVAIYQVSRSGSNLPQQLQINTPHQHENVLDIDTLSSDLPATFPTDSIYDNKKSITD